CLDGRAVPRAGLAAGLTTHRASVLMMRLAGMTPPPGLPTAWGGAGRRWGGTWNGCSACLSLGLGTQPAGLWATTCCVPVGVITPNVAAVKPLHVSDRLRLGAQADGPGQDPDPGQQAYGYADVDRGQHAIDRADGAADECA